jgi:predicted nucleotidyltransferase
LAQTKASKTQQEEKNIADRAIHLSRQYHVRCHAHRELARERLRQEQYQRVTTAILHLAPNYPALQTVYLFGSLVQPGRYRHHSDIDVAVICDDPATESRFWQALEAELRCDVDLRVYQGAVAWAVDTYGECIYERKISLADTRHSA